jgi:hypothetical protein
MEGVLSSREPQPFSCSKPHTALQCLLFVQDVIKVEEGMGGTYFFSNESGRKVGAWSRQMCAFLLASAEPAPPVPLSGRDHEALRRGADGPQQPKSRCWTLSFRI